MSIYIPGMEIPQSCAECLNIGWHYVFECCLDDMEDGRKLPSCPLAPVQKHGRLIDVDMLYESCALDTNIDVMVSVKRINEYMQLKIDEAPTIIPTKEGE